MAAAIAAAEAGSSVMVLQKIDELGGSTTMAVGSFSAPGTALQQEAGIEDSVEAHLEDMKKFVEKYSEGSTRDYNLDLQDSMRDRDDHELKEVVVREGAETLEWLRGHGCEYAGPFPEPPHRVPRMHVIQPDTGAYATVLGDALDELGVDVSYNTAARELVSDGDGVRGVRATRTDGSESMAVKARRGVVLATGSYINNVDIRREYTTNATAEAINEHNTGDGHLMARDAGADLVNMDLQGLTMRLGDPLYTAPDIGSLVDAGAILVDESGERFLNEVIGYDQIFSAVTRLPGGVCYIVMDRDVADQFTEWPDYISTFPGTAYGYLDDYRETEQLSEADSPDRLADEAGLGNLPATIAEYNEAAVGNTVDRYGRSTHLRPLSRRPYYSLGPVKPYSVVTDGGVAVDTAFRVLDDGQPIPGLFAAGSVAGGALLIGHGHHHLYVFTSGRIAGTTAAEADGR